MGERKKYWYLQIKSWFFEKINKNLKTFTDFYQRKNEKTNKHLEWEKAYDYGYRYILN